jgi:hypothetical protein
MICTTCGKEVTLPHTCDPGKDTTTNGTGGNPPERR